MSLLKHLEDEAEHLLVLVKHMAQVQMNMQGVVSETTQKLHDILDAHVNPTPAPVVDAAPVAAVVEPTIVVEAPQTVAQEQSASNVAN